MKRPQKCEFCGQDKNAAMTFYNQETRLCRQCLDQMEMMPDIVEKSIARFLIGNVV